MKHLYFAVLLLASCQPQATRVPSHVPPSPVPKAVPVAESVSAVRSATEEVARSGERAEVKVAAAVREAATLREGLEDAVAEADRLRQAKTATEEDLTKMWQRLTALTQRNLFLEEEMRGAERELANQRELRRQAMVQITVLEQRAAEKDREAALLRTQYEDAEAIREATAKAADAIARERDTARTEADKLKGEVRLYRWVAGVLAGILVVWIVVKVFLPPRF